jgi:hypothetical protein
MLNQLYIVTLYLVRCYLTSVVLTTGGTLWNLVMSSQLMVVQSSDFLPLFTPRFADPYFESSKNMASSHLDGKFHQFHHQKLSSRSLVYHGKKIRGIMPFYGRTIQNYSNLPRWLWNDGVWVGVIWPKKGWKFCILWTGDVSILFGVLNPPILQDWSHSRFIFSCYQDEETHSDADVSGLQAYTMSKEPRQ